MLSQQDLASYYSEEAAKVLDPVLKFLQQHGIQAVSRTEVGNPGEAIAHCAADGKFELVIMGSHGNGALARLVMGSVASKVLASCRAPVLLIR